MSRSQDSRRYMFFGVLFCASTVLTPTPTSADPLLIATADGSAAALCVGGQPRQSIIPGAGSVTVLFGAAASGNCAGNEASASVVGAAEARFGELAGHARAEAIMAFLTPNLVGASAGLVARFIDTAEIVSSTLAPGTPVTLSFLMTLEAIAFHTFNAPVLGSDSRVAASASTFALISDIEALDRTSFSGPSTFSGLAPIAFQFGTAVGHHLQLDASLQINVQIGLWCLRFPEHCATAAVAEVIAENTAHFFYQPSGDVRLVSGSGHDYAVGGSGPRPVPEPAFLSFLCVTGGPLLFVARRRLRAAKALGVNSMRADTPSLPTQEQIALSTP